MATDNDNGIARRPIVRTPTYVDGNIAILGLPRVLLSRCGVCGSCQKVTVKAAQAHLTIFCPCGEIARLSHLFINKWTIARFKWGTI